MNPRPRAWIVLFALTLTAAVPATQAREVPFAAGAPLPGLPDSTYYTYRAEADIDGDGDLDVFAVDDCCANPVLWFEQVNGSSPPTFVQHTLFTLGANESTNRIVAVDLDRDGDMDLALLIDNDDADSVRVSWAENDGTPAIGAWTRRNIVTWNPPFGGRLLSLGGFLGNLASADVDGDGDPDLIVSYAEVEILETAADGRVVWLSSDGTPADGGWTTEPLVDWRTDRAFSNLTPADLDSDGDLDLLLGVYNTDQNHVDDLQWAENDGTPGIGYWVRREITDLESTCCGPAYPAVADFDRDGDLDVAAGDEGNGLRWFESDGTPANGGWIAHTINPDGFGGIPIDLDHDGDIDLLTGLSWYENDGTPRNGGWIHRLVSELSGFPVDLDRDGDTDAVMSIFNKWSENLEIHRSAVLRDERTVNTLVDDAFDVAVGDLDGDGDLDLVSAAEAGDHVYWHRNDGTPGNDTVWNLSTLTSAVDGPRAVALGDLDGDGDLDVVVASFNDNSVSWLENDGTLANWTKRVISAGAGGANDVAVGDFDRDGDLDVACVQYLDDEVVWYRNNGANPPAFGAHFVDSLPYAGPRALAVGDLDGDGDLDLAVVSENTDRVVWYGNDGSPADGEWFRHRTDSGESDGPKDVALADLDRDGDLDMLVANYVGDQALWYENDGTFVGWTARAITTCNGVRSVAAADFDQDGDDDVLVSCFDEDRVKLQASNGGSPPDLSSTVWSTLGANGARTVLAADLDRDGDLDGVVAQGLDGQIAWYENQGGQFRVAGTAIAANQLVNDAVQGVFRLVVTHRGRSGDGSLELAAVAVRLEEAAGDPLNPFQAVAVIDEIRIYGDDGDNTFEPGVDPLLAVGGVAGIDGAGAVWVDLPDDLLGAAISAVSQRTFFVALDLAAPFFGGAPETLRVTLLTDGAAVCEADDREHQIPLDLQWSANVSTATLALVDVAGALFSDGFESGDTSAWSLTIP